MQTKDQWRGSGIRTFAAQSYATQVTAVYVLPAADDEPTKGKSEYGAGVHVIFLIPESTSLAVAAKLTLANGVPVLV
jgi:hypothetical protein